MRTHNIPLCYRKSKRSSLFLLTWRFYRPSLARTTRLELIFMVPKVFEPLKFDCNFIGDFENATYWLTKEFQETGILLHLHVFLPLFSKGKQHTCSM